MAVGTTRGKRRLGRFIKPIVERAGLTVDQLAAKTVCHPQTITRLLSGRSLPSGQRFATILAVLGATDDERAQALQLWAVADVDAGSIEHADDLPTQYRRFRLDEAEALREQTLDTVILPGILQTPEYTMELSRVVQDLLSSPDGGSRAVADRRSRLELLTRDRNPLILDAFIDEFALRRPIGGPEVMSAQYNHLLSLNTAHNVRIRYLPSALGAYGPLSGEIISLGFHEDDEPDAVYLGHFAGTVPVTKPKQLMALSRLFERLTDIAASTEDTSEFIRELCRE